MSAAASLILLDSAWALQQKPERKQPDPFVSVHKAGFRINSQVVKAMNLKNGDTILLTSAPFARYWSYLIPTSI